MKHTTPNCEILTKRPLCIAFGGPTSMVNSVKHLFPWHFLSKSQPHPQECGQWSNGRHDMGAETSSPNPSSNQPHNHTTSLLSVLHLYTNPMLSQMGLSTHPLHQRHQDFPFSPSKVGILSLSQKSLQIRMSWNFVEVQVPIPTASTINSCKGIRGSTVGRWTKKRVC